MPQHQHVALRDVPEAVEPAVDVSPMSLSTFNDDLSRVSMLATLMHLLDDVRFNGAVYVFQDYTSTTLPLLLDVLVEHIDANTSDTFHLALSALHEAICGRPALHEHTKKSAQQVRTDIVQSVGPGKDLFEIIRNRPMSSMSPLFMALLSPADLYSIFEHLGFQNPELVPWHSPDPELHNTEVLDHYAQFAADYTVGDRVAIAYTSSAAVVNVFSKELSRRSACCIEQQLLSRTIHPLDLMRLNREVGLFTETQALSAPEALSTMRNYLYLARQPMLQSRDCLTTTCTHGMLRLLSAWTSVKSTLRMAADGTLVDRILTNAPATAYDCRVSVPSWCWGFLNMPSAARSAWFLNHPIAPTAYDLDRYLRAPEGVRKQYEMGLMYSLVEDTDIRENLPTDFVLRFCIALVGGIRQTEKETSPLFDSTVVLVAPPRSLSTLLRAHQRGVTAAPRLLCTPVTELQTHAQRLSVLTGRPMPSVQSADYVEILLAAPPVAPLTGTGVSPLAFSSLFTSDVWGRLPAVNGVEDLLRDLYSRMSDTTAQRHGRNDVEPTDTTATASAHLGRSPSDRAPDRDSNSNRTKRDRSNSDHESSQKHKRVRGVYYGEGYDETRVPVSSNSSNPSSSTPPSTYQGLLSTLPSPTRPTGQPSFQQLALRGLELLPTIPWNNLTSAPRSTLVEKFVHYTRISAAAPVVGEKFMLLIIDDPEALRPDFCATWADVIGGHTAMYKVKSVRNNTFSATFETVYSEPQDFASRTWPQRVQSLPYPCTRYPYRLVFDPTVLESSDSSASDSSSGDEYERDAREERTVRHQADRNPVGVRTHSTSDPSTVQPQRSHSAASSRKRANPDQRTGRMSEFSSSDSDSSSTKSDRDKPEKHRTRTALDRGGNLVAYTNSATAAQIRDTTSVRAVAGMQHIDVLLQEQGNLLNNYTLHDFVVGAVSLFRSQSRVAPLSPGVGSGLMAAPAMALVWFTHRTALKDVALAIFYWNWCDMLTVTATSPRLTHMLPLDRVRALQHNELGTWHDFTDALLGLEQTYGLMYPPPWEQTFHEFHQMVVRHQIGALLTPAFLEYWLLDVLAFIRRASRDPSRPVSPSDRVQYPAPLTTTSFSPSDWCALMTSKLHYRLPLLTISNNDAFTRSLTFPVQVSLLHPYGTFSEKPRTLSQREPAAEPAPPTATNKDTPKRVRGDKQQEGSKNRGSVTDATVATPRTPRSERLCLHGLCAHYKIPLVTTPYRAGGIPPKCKTDCPYMHIGDLPEGTQKTALLAKYKPSLEKQLDKSDLDTFIKKFNADTRIP